MKMDRDELMRKDVQMVGERLENENIMKSPRDNHTAYSKMKLDGSLIRLYNTICIAVFFIIYPVERSGLVEREETTWNRS